MKRKAALILLILSLAAGARAQGIRDSVFSVPVVKVTAGDMFRPASAGMKESRVDSIIITEKISSSLSGLLSENSNIFIKSHGRGALATASFRGTAPSHTQVSWNGIEINTPMSGMVDFSLIPVYIIDGLSISHGSASIARHSGGLGGSVEISNEADWSDTFSGRYMQGIGSYSTFDEYLGISAGNRKLQVKTRLYHNYSANDYTFVNRGIANIDPSGGQLVNPIDTNHNASYIRYGILQEIYFRPGSRDILSLKYWGQDSKRTLPRATSYEGPDNSNLNNQQSRDHRLTASWEHYGDSSRLQLRTAYTAKDLDYVLKNNIYGAGLIPVIYSQSSQSGFINKVSYRLNMKHGVKLEAGLDAGFYNVSTLDTVSGTGYEQSRFELSSFVGVHRQFADRLNIRIMMRQDLADGQLLPLIPYLGFDYRLLRGHDLVLKANIARNYRQPSLNDLYWEPGGNPGLEPEKGVSAEAGLEFSGSTAGQKIDAELTFYRSDISNWIIWIPGYKGYWEPRNIKRVLSQGLELNASLSGSAGRLGYSINAGYAYTSSVNYGDTGVWGDESYGKQLVYVPLHSANVMTKLNYGFFSLGWQYNYYSERFTTSSNDISRRDWLYPYFMNDLSAGMEKEIKNLTLSAELKVYNIFNETYHSILYRPMPGRNYMLILMIKF